MDLTRFASNAPGELVRISGTDPYQGPWQHAAFLPTPLPAEPPHLSTRTYRLIGDARAALAALDSTARQLPNPRLLRRPTLQTEAQSTSALEGTYAPLQTVLTADDDPPSGSDLREVLNYVTMADTAFAWKEEGRPLTLSALGELQRILVRETRGEDDSSGSVRNSQVVIGRRSTAQPDDLPVKAARFVPAPPGPDLEARVRDLLDWMQVGSRTDIDPVVAAAMAHYQFETLHPFHDGNGRVGRLLVVLHLMTLGVITEPSLTVSPWFESRREEYYDRLLAVSTHDDWDAFVRFFAIGLAASASRTQEQMLALVDVQHRMREAVRRSTMRANTAQALVDYAVAHPSFTVRAVERDLSVSYGRANALISQLVDLGLLAPLSANGYRRRFCAPGVIQVILHGRGTSA